MSRCGIKYTEIARASVTPTRNIVISHCSKGGFTIAQQLTVKETPNVAKDTAVYLKGAFHVDGLSGLYNLRDAINLTIHQVETGGTKAQTVWDEEAAEE